MTIFRDDRPLLDAFRRGDRAAAERVYYHYVDDVDKLVRRGFILDAKETIRVPGIGDADAAADLVQEVFVRALSEPARLSYDGLRPYRPYLLRIAKNLLIDRLRATKNAAIVSLTGLLAGLDVEARLAFIRARLRHDAHRARQWSLGFGTSYSIIAVGSIARLRGSSTIRRSSADSSRTSAKSGERFSSMIAARSATSFAFST